MRFSSTGKGTLRALGAGLFASALFAGASQPASAALYGLVVGIDDYIGTANDLNGAVNDALDIAGALKKAGAARVVMLTDGEATKRAIAENWSNLLARAAPGDTIVFSYAGHGGQEPEPPGRNGEKDGKNENFLLAGYSPHGPGTAERIVDDEIYEWLLAADQKGVKVVLVADSCHSGTMNRGASAEGVKFRNGKFGDLDLADDVLKMPPPEIATKSENDTRFVTFIGATLESRLTPEIIIDGTPRGALSWAFSRALEGAADRNHDGKLTQLELLSFLVPTVETRAEGQQTPQISPLRPGDEPVIGGLVETTPASAPADETALTVAVLGTADPAIAAIPGIALAKDTASADLVWNPASGVVEHRVGGPVAEDVRTLADLRPVLAKWSALAFLKDNAGVNPAELTLASGNQTYRVGEQVHITMAETALPYLTMFNLPPNGRVEFFLPANAREAATDWRQRVFSERFEVKNPPFGAEHLVAILTEEPVPALHAALKQMSTPDAATALADTLRSLLAGKRFDVGIAAIYTSGN
ncbi:MAG: caspase family protein [Hyphomicrobiales bacterium]